MSDPRLPPELLDHIVSFLREDVESQTLKNCCLVAKSWVPRARKRLFGAIWIPSRVGFEAWWKVFPDPDSSPGHYTRSLTFRTVGFLFSGVPGGCSLIRPFSNVVRLEMVSCYETPTVASPKFFEFICSFPLLEDLVVAVYEIGKDDNDGPVLQPRASPPLTGTLVLWLEPGIEHVSRGLLALSNGVHFRKFMFTWHVEEDYQWVMALVERCSDTLESFKISRSGHSSEALIDLSKATKLRQVAFVFETDANWITNTLNTILPEHRDLQKILIYVGWYYDISAEDRAVDSKEVVGEEVYKQWMELDGRLVQLWDAHAAPTKVIAGRDEFKLVTGLLPELTKRGVLQLVTSAEEHFYDS